MENIKLGVIIGGDAYELVDYTHCRDCTYKGKDECCSCSRICNYIEDILLQEDKRYMLKKVESTILENTKPLDSDISKLVDNNFFDLI